MTTTAGEAAALQEEEPRGALPTTTAPLLPLLYHLLFLALASWRNGNEYG
jgi:hypothetical protein